MTIAPGFELVGLEVPVKTPLGTVVVDALLHHAGTNVLVPCEVKSGANVEDKQAKNYAAIDPTALVQAAQVTVRQRARPIVVPLYACLDQHLERIRLGLSEANVGFAIVSFGDDVASLHPVAALPAPLRDLVWPVRLAGPAPTIIAFDQDSEDAAIRPAVQAELVAALAHRRPQVSLPYLTERAAPNLALYGRRAKNQLVRRVGEVARAIAAEDPETFAFVPAPANGEAIVHLLKTPEDNDPRGRTQAYQALSRSASRRRRSSRPSDPDQLDLLQVIEEDDDDGANTSGQGEEGDG